MARSLLAALPALASLVLGAACSSQECEDKRDCPTGFQCTSGSCTRIPSGNGGGSASPDAGIFDMGFRADGGDAGDDAGDAGDGGGGGNPDAGDGGVPDGGNLDGGANARGVVWLAELRVAGGSEFVAYGELADYSNVQVQGSLRNYPDQEGGSCNLLVERRTGAPVGIPAQRIVVTAGAATVTLEPAMGPGRYEPLTPPPTRMFSETSIVLYAFSGTGQTGSVTNHSVTTRSPSIVFELTPGLGTPVTLAGGPSITWVPSGLAQDVTIEAYDANREVVLICYTDDDGSYRIPMAAASAFVAETRTAPSRLEIRHDSNTMTSVPRMGGTPIPTLVRSSWGNRFTVAD